LTYVSSCNGTEENRIFSAFIASGLAKVSIEALEAVPTYTIQQRVRRRRPFPRGTRNELQQIHGAL
jgi:hypothetical protein